MLTRDEVVDLLTVISAYDNRKPNPASVLAWAKAAELGRWTPGEAVQAVHEHFAESTEYLMPAHVGTRIRSVRQDRAMREEAAALAGPIHPKVLGAVREFSERRAIGPGGEVRRAAAKVIAEALPAPRVEADSPFTAEEVAAAKRVGCPWCRARPFHECTQPGGGRRRAVPHPSRVDAAKAGGVA